MHAANPPVARARSAGRVRPRRFASVATRRGQAARERRRRAVRPLLWILLVVLSLLVLIGPFLVGRFIYQATYNELKAGYDVATGTLDTLKPRLNDLELASRLVAKRVEPSVVSIVRPGRRGLDGQGSGVIVDKAGYIVTNFHVVEGAERSQVRLSDRRTAEARSSATIR